MPLPSSDLEVLRLKLADASSLDTASVTPAGVIDMIDEILLLRGHAEKVWSLVESEAMGHLRWKTLIDELREVAEPVSWKKF